MKVKRKRRMSRRRRERTYIAVMVLLAIAVSIGLTRSVMRDDKEFEEYEQQSQEFNARMQRIDEKREASGQNAMLEQVRTWQQSRHVTYNNTRRDPRAAEFYLSKEWRELRPVIMSVYEYVDIYALYVEHQLITLKDSDPIHHIIELEEDWEQRLNPLNLIPLSHRTHNTITALYKQSNASMKATQTQLRSLIDYHFKEAGGYEKVLCDRFLVAPPLFFGENSPRENQDAGE